MSKNAIVILQQSGLSMIDASAVAGMTSVGIRTGQRAYLASAQLTNVLSQGRPAVL